MYVAVLDGNRIAYFERITKFVARCSAELLLGVGLICSCWPCTCTCYNTCRLATFPGLPRDCLQYTKIDGEDLPCE